MPRFDQGAFSRPLIVLNALLLLVWLVVLAGWVIIENHRYELLARDHVQQQQIKAADVLAYAQEQTLAVTNLLRGNRLIIDGLLVEDYSRLLDTTLPMMQLPYVQLLTVYRASGEIAAQAHQPAVFGRKDELSPWLAATLIEGQPVAITVAEVGRRLYLLTGGRVDDLNGLSGFVVLGTLLDRGFIERLARATGAQVEMRFVRSAASDNSAGKDDVTLRLPLTLPSHLAAAGLRIDLLDPLKEIRKAWWQNLLVGVVSLLLAGAFMLAVAVISSRELAKSHQSLLRARDDADAASRAKGELLAREEEQHRRLDLLVRCSNVGSLEWDAVSRQATCSPRLVQMLGRAPEADTAGWAIEQSIHPEDRETVMQRFFGPMRPGAVVETVAPIESLEFRLLRADGTSIWVHGDAITVASDGKAQKFLASFIDITPILAAEEDTRVALKQQQQLNELRSRFVSMTSHEFRTPLASILSSAQLLKEYADRLSTTDKNEILGSIETGVQRMTGMMDKVLNIGRAESGMLEFKPAPLKLRELCAVMLDHARSSHPDTSCVLTADFDIAEAEGLYDEKLLRHIFDNLLSNAIKYSPKGGEVRFTVRREEGHMLFRVSDRGIGIPADEIPHMFESFHRASNVGNISGTGLGLAIVKNAVDLHGGEIQVSSQLRQGTTITVRL